MHFLCFFFFFFFNDTATTEIYTLSLHDALPISGAECPAPRLGGTRSASWRKGAARRSRSEEHTSELQSRSDLVCRLLLEKKKKATKLRTRHAHRARAKSRLLVGTLSIL